MKMFCALAQLEGPCCGQLVMLQGSEHAMQGFAGQAAVAAVTSSQADTCLVTTWGTSSSV